MDEVYGDFIYGVVVRKELVEVKCLVFYEVSINVIYFYYMNFFLKV